jgi:hypothetical protein
MVVYQAEKIVNRFSLGYRYFLIFGCVNVKELIGELKVYLIYI